MNPPQKTRLGKTPAEPHSYRMPNEAKGLILLGCCAILSLSLMSFSMHASSKNWLGLVGWGIGWVFNFTFGLCTYLIIAFGAIMGWQYLLNRQISLTLSKVVYFAVFLISCCALLNLIAEFWPSFGHFFEDRIYTQTYAFDLPYPYHKIRYNLGGVPLYYLYCDLPTLNLQKMLSDVGVALTFSITALVSFLLLTQIRLIPLLIGVRHQIQSLYRKVTTPSEDKEKSGGMNPKSKEEIEQALSKCLPQPIYQVNRAKESGMQIRTMHDKAEEEKKNPPLQNKRKAVTDPQKAAASGDFTTYQIPPASLLNNPKKIDHPSLKKDLKRQAEILEETLLSFGIEAKVGQINCGPTITSFEVHPAIGVKVQKIKTLRKRHRPQPPSAIHTHHRPDPRQGGCRR